MINTSLKRQYGIVTLVITIILIMVSTLIIIFAANYGVMQQKSMANLNRYNQAFEAAEAGLEFGINYLQKNSATILASPVAGYIQPYTNSSVTNVTLANNSRFTVVYTNPVVNNYTRILVTSTGSSDDGTATRIVSQEVQFGSMLLNAPTSSLVSKGSVTMGGSSNIINLYSNVNVQAGAGVTLSGSSSTILSSGVSSTPGNIQSDIQQNVSSINSQSTNDFFISYFGVPSNTIKNTVANYYTNSSSQNYSGTLSGLSGTSIWIEQTGGTARVNGNVTIGSPTNPVLLIINGDFDIGGGAVIYGFVYVSGTATTDIVGNVTINGGLVTGANLAITGSADLAYNPTVLTNLRNQSSMMYYAKVPGTWKDF